MKAIEFNSSVGVSGKIGIPKEIRESIPEKRPLRVILLWDNDGDREETLWQEAALKVFGEGDGLEDALYDDL